MIRGNLESFPRVSLLFVYSGGVWHVPQPSGLKTSWPRGEGIELVLIRGRLERIDVQRECVQLLIAVTAKPFGSRQLLESRHIGRYEPRIAGQAIRSLVHCCISHQVANRAVYLSPVRSR